MATIVDARGFGCPQPVLMTLEQIKKQKTGDMEVLVDTETSRENVSRAAQSQGWKVSGIEEQKEGGYRLRLQRG